MQYSCGLVASKKGLTSVSRRIFTQPRRKGTFISSNALQGIIECNSCRAVDIDQTSAWMFDDVCASRVGAFS